MGASILAALLLFQCALLAAASASEEPSDVCSSGLLDIVYIIDGSTSIYPGNFTRALDLIKQLTLRLPVNENGVRIGLIQFNGRQRTEFSLNTHKTKAGVMRGLNATRYQMGVTHAGAAVNYALSTEFTPRKGDRAEARNVIIVLSDGLIQDNIEEPARRAAESGVEVFAVGVTTLWWDFALVQLCNGKKENVIESDSLFNDFPGTVEKLMYKVTRGKCGKDDGSGLDKTGNLIDGKEGGNESGTGADGIDTNSVLGGDGDGTGTGTGTGTGGKGGNGDGAGTGTSTGTGGKGGTGTGNGGNGGNGKGVVIPDGNGKWTAQGELTAVDEVEIKCGSEGIEVSATAEKKFTGNVYVKGFFHDSNCKKSFANNENRGVHINVPITACGVRRERDARGIFVSFTVVFMSHRFVLTKLDKAFRVQCFYMETDKTVTQQLDVSMITTVGTVTHMAMPTCTYTLREGSHNGPEVEYATLGMRVFHRWECRGPQAVDYMFGMKIHSCYARDSNNEQVLILNEDGCSVDKYVMSDLEYESDLITAYVGTNVFKFADVSDIYFECQVKICLKPDGCEGVTPPTCQASGRGKRRKRNTVYDLYNRDSTSFNVTTPRISVLETVAAEPTDLLPESVRAILPPGRERAQEQFCISPVTFSAVGAVVFALLMLSLVLSFVLYRTMYRQTK